MIVNVIEALLRGKALTLQNRWPVVEDINVSSRITIRWDEGLVTQIQTRSLTAPLVQEFWPWEDRRQIRRRNDSALPDMCFLRASSPKSCQKGQSITIPAVSGKWASLWG